jgi:hypothetical protein
MSRRSQRQVTLTIVALLALLIGVRLLSTHPLPQPSHATPEAAVAGYVGGLERLDLKQVERYLAPVQRPHASSMLEALSRDHATIQAPSLSEVTEQGDQATVTLSLQVCYQNSGRRSYTCEPLDHAPLGLPTQIECQRLNGNWYASTLFKPT